MKKILIAVALFQLASVSIHAAASECSSVKPDKARLKCYDLREASQTASPKEDLAAKAESAKIQEQEFKKLAAGFVRNGQTNLALSSLMWLNFMDSPSSTRTAETLAKGREIESEMSERFSALAKHPGYTGQISEKLKDYYAAWGLTYSLIQPTSSDSLRGYKRRADIEMAKQDALAARLNMDFQ